MDFLETLKQLDIQLLLAINGAHTPFLDTLLFWMTKLWFWLPLFALVVFSLFKKYGKKTWLMLAFLGVSVFLTDRTSVGIKNSVQRYRPSHNVEINDGLHFHIYKDGKEYRGGKYGFVSSHAANSFGVVVLLIYFMLPITRHAWWIFPTWAALFCYTRMYLGVHYPSDIFCGAILGLICGFISLFLYKIVSRFIEKRKIKDEPDTV